MEGTNNSFKVLVKGFQCYELIFFLFKKSQVPFNVSWMFCSMEIGSHLQHLTIKHES